MPKTGGLFGKKSGDSIAQMKEQMAEKLKNEIQETQKETQEKILEIVDTSKDEYYSDSDMNRVWVDFVIQLNKGSLSFLKERKLKNDNHKITLVLASNHERSLCEEHRLNALQYFRINLKNTQINLDFEVDSTLIPETKSLSVEDKFNKMVEQNPDLATLRQLLELEIEY
jgi:hypothetical protein